MTTLWELTITTDPVLEETCLWRLEDWATVGVAAEVRPTGLWVRAYLLEPPLTTKVQGLREELALDGQTFELVPPQVTVTELPHQDWATQWMQFWKPRPVGERFMICPAWMTCEPGERIVLKLDAGLAFGTGEHETTRLCLTLLESYVTLGATIADIGCGSGVLTIGALLLGAGPTQAVDLEEQAVRATQHNLALNDLTAQVMEGSIEHITPPVTGIVCNILAPVICTLLPQLHQALQPGGWAILSGILATQIPMVTAALGEAWTLEKTLQEGQWVALAVRAIP
jgi:ribosomal protein L11 methyltransferase